MEEKDLERTRETKWVLAKGKKKEKAGDFLLEFASKRLLRLETEV